MKKELPKVYEPREVEGRVYEMWEKNGCFEGHRDPDKRPFTIVMPPPNVTGQLHMGHAMDCTLQDILIRFKRMQGYAALWVPGTDHAGIATQIKVEEELRKSEGLTRYDLGREKFLERVWDWKHKFGNRIVEQQKKLGASCDWSRARFTMDEGLSNAVRHVFVSLYNKGLIYKGSRIINWCPHCVTALSDAEVEYKEKPGHLWHIRYPIAGEEGRYVTVATTRPETMLGDTGVAVNPEDGRYRDIVGKKCILPLVNKEIPIVADAYVDMEFGTGCVKMTPAHDPNDFEVGLRHNLESIRVLDDNGKVVEGYGRYSGMDRYEARKAIVADLEEGGYLVKVEEHTHNVGTCYRCGTDVEPIISAQWFVKMEPLAREALRVVNDGEVKFVPDRFSKIYTNWMENVHDWCISRQLWWGHRIPAWTCEDCGEMTVSETDPTECQHCHSTHIRQEEDVLDTWFSSALWPFSTLGWPNESSEDFKYFYPTDVLVTGYDIIFFWVARMIFSACEHTGKPPFHTVFIHGLVRDDKGRKMSKSLGNGIDPLEMADQYGADALRFNLITGNSPGNDMRFYTERCEAMRNFANKIWKRQPLPDDEPDHRPVRAARPAGAGGQVDPLQAQLRHPRGHGEHGALRAGRGRPEGVRLHLGLLLRLVYRADQDPPPGGGRGQQALGPAGTLLRAHRDPQAAPPLHALYHRGDLAGPAPQRRLPDAPAVAAAPRRAGLPRGGEGHGADHGRHPGRARPPRRDERAPLQKGAAHRLHPGAGCL